MKLVATYKDKIYPVIAIDYSSNQIMLYVDYKDGMQYENLIVDISLVKVHLSTDMRDKNGKEILVGDKVDIRGIIAEIIFNGTEYWCGDALGYYSILTLELAAMLEVVE